MQLSTSSNALAILDAASSAPLPGLPSLLGTPLSELEQFAADLGMPAYRGRQIFSGLFAKQAQSFDDLTSLPKGFRAQLRESYALNRPTIDQVQVSTDGTRKYRFVAEDQTAFEAVYIPQVARGRKTNTLCVSSQTGCAVGCRFCFTASLRRNRNLSAAEIVGQVLAVQENIQTAGSDARITNIVFMGMGEPLLNYTEVTRSIRVLIDTLGLDYSTRRITVSTAGIVPRIHELGRDLPTQLAISLNATTDEVRDQIMPINKKWPLQQLIAALKAYPLAKRRRITVEYVLLKDLNDTPQDAHRLVRLLEGIPVKINLLPLNPHDRTSYLPPSANSVQRFQRILHDKGMNALLRTPRGQDIAAACGQLGETVRPASP